MRFALRTRQWNAPALRFKWQTGQTLAYRVIQQTTVTETTLEEKTNKPITGESKTGMMLVRRWTVKETDPAGVGVVRLR